MPKVTPLERSDSLSAVKRHKSHHEFDVFNADIEEGPVTNLVTATSGMDLTSKQEATTIRTDTKADEPSPRDFVHRLLVKLRRYDEEAAIAEAEKAKKLWPDFSLE